MKLAFHGIAFALAATPLILVRGSTTQDDSPWAVNSSSSAHESVFVPHVVASPGDKWSGEIRCVELLVPAGVNVAVVGDLRIIASDSVTIEGVLKAQDRTDVPAAHGWTVSIEAGMEILVGGSIDGGRGWNGIPEAPQISSSRYRGGDGSGIELTAPRIFIDGVVRGGKGGDGDPGMSGGAGGDILFMGRFLTHQMDDDFEAISGGGGKTGRSIDRDLPPPVANRSGGVWIFHDPSAEARWNEKRLELVRAGTNRHDLSGALGTTIAPYADCGGEADPASTGGDATGDPGGQGSTGSNGTVNSPDGGPGGIGATPGPIFSDPGTTLTGEPPACCTPAQQGIKGGAGGWGGRAVGGLGGTGGTGGPGYHDGTTYIGRGGKGGPGSPGGHATAGDGGNGQKGGRGVPPGAGGNKGRTRVAWGGVGGAHGQPGPGNGNLGFEPNGGEGQATQGTDGNPGASGDACPDEGGGN